LWKWNPEGNALCTSFRTRLETGRRLFLLQYAPQNVVRYYRDLKRTNVLFQHGGRQRAGWSVAIF